jgi:hypothetical protein
MSNCCSQPPTLVVCAVHYEPPLAPGPTCPAVPCPVQPPAALQAPRMRAASRCGACWRLCVKPSGPASAAAAALQAAAGAALAARQRLAAVARSGPACCTRAAATQAALPACSRPDSAACRWVVGRVGGRGAGAVPCLCQLLECNVKGPANLPLCPARPAPAAHPHLPCPICPGLCPSLPCRAGRHRCLPC